MSSYDFGRLERTPREDLRTSGQLVHANLLAHSATPSRTAERVSYRPHAAGELAASAARAFGISQPATSRHLRVLREAGLVVARADGTRRIYSLADDALDGLDEWVARLRTLWAGPMLALETEISRGQHDRRSEAALRPGRSTRDEGATP